jgi:adenylosuccinate synthase
MVNGATQLIMTKADVLDAFEQLSVCTAYKINGEETGEVPFQMTRVDIQPVLKTFKGWNRDISSLKLEKELPAEMRSYVEFINNFLGVKVTYISNGPISPEYGSKKIHGKIRAQNT